MFPNESFDGAQLRATEAAAPCQARWAEPELGSAAVSLDVRGLFAVSGVEEKPIWAVYEDRRHGPFYFTRRAGPRRAAPPCLPLCRCAFALSPA